LYVRGEVVLRAHTIVCVCQESHTYTTTNLIELFSQERAQDSGIFPLKKKA